MICIRRARPGDAAAIGAVHVACWRNTYAGVLPAAYLAGLSELRHAAGFDRAIADRRQGHAVFVAVASGGTREGSAEDGTVVGFASAGRARRAGLGDGEIETLYLLDDWQDRGVGRRLMRAAGAHLAAVGCRSVMLWVLRENPTQFFYRRLGGRPAAVETIRVAGQSMEQLAYVWDPIEALLNATSPAREG